MEKYMSNSYGEVEVISRVGKKCVVRFVNTGYIREANIDNVRAGKVKDNSVIYEPPTKIVNEVIETSYGMATIISITGRDCIVQFHDTGYTKKANIDNVRAGKIKDPYAKTCFGVAYQGEFKKVSYWKQASQLWRNMLKRCYSEKDPRGYYGKGVTVDDRWKCFANFLEDLPSLENFDKWLAGHNEGNIKYNLDKDKKFFGNKVYSKETCMFLSEFENKGLTSKTNRVGKV